MKTLREVLDVLKLCNFVYEIKLVDIYEVEIDGPTDPFLDYKVKRITDLKAYSTSMFPKLLTDTLIYSYPCFVFYIQLDI